MTTKPNLAELAETSGSARQIPAPPEPQQNIKKANDKRTIKPREEIQEKLVPVSGLFPKPVRDQFKILSIKNGKTLQEQLTEAINDCFAKHELPEIAPTKNGK